MSYKFQSLIIDGVEYEIDLDDYSTTSETIAYVSGNYLPLTGGTLTGMLNSNATSSNTFMFTHYNINGDSVASLNNYNSTHEILRMGGDNTEPILRLQNGSYFGQLRVPTPTGNRTYYLPDASGTVALTSDLEVKSPSSGTDLNDYKSTGVWHFTSSTTPTNIPSGVNGTLIVYAYGNNYVKQMWYRRGTNNSNDWQTYVRQYNSNGWSNWKRYAMTDEVADVDEKLAINMVKYPYYTSSGTTDNSITYTYGEDGIITMTGTASGLSDFVIVALNDNVEISPSTTYTFSGISGGSDSTYFMRLTTYDSDSSNIENVDFYDGATTFTTAANAKYIRLTIYVRSGITVNETISPMLEKGDTAHSYKRYCGEGETLNDVLANNFNDMPTSLSDLTGDIAIVDTTVATDLNDYKTTGIWHFPHPSSSAPVPTNIPSGVNGTLIAYACGTYVKQVWYRLGTNNGDDWQTYVRQYIGSKGWSSWKRYAIVNDIPTKLSDLTDDVVSGVYQKRSRTTSISTATYTVASETSTNVCTMSLSKGLNIIIVGVKVPESVTNTDFTMIFSPTMNMEIVTAGTSEHRYIGGAIGSKRTVLDFVYTAYTSSDTTLYANLMHNNANSITLHTYARIINIPTE